MNDEITVGAAALMTTLVGATAIARTWPASRHRVPKRLPSLADLIGRPSAYTTPDYADVPSHGVVAQAWRPCSGPCEQEMPSVLHVDGSWQCGHCFTVSGGAE